MTGRKMAKLFSQKKRRKMPKLALAETEMPAQLKSEEKR
jgi:hypothetical protein